MHKTPFVDDIYLLDDINYNVAGSQQGKDIFINKKNKFRNYCILFMYVKIILHEKKSKGHLLNFFIDIKRIACYRK